MGACGDGRSPLEIEPEAGGDGRSPPGSRQDTMMEAELENSVGSDSRIFWLMSSPGTRLSEQMPDERRATSAQGQEPEPNELPLTLAREPELDELQTTGTGNGAGYVQSTREQSLSQMWDQCGLPPPWKHDQEQPHSLTSLATNTHTIANPPPPATSYPPPPTTSAGETQSNQSISLAFQ
ncbi:hypothetical protein Q5P01_013946 [Channa striata]|uniref:Uncharacterized protein n=1 Tax=Channa striata TaxID=64152 RepID=A0AA88ML77_CHASR|nr:hypothetical protein Q5P01_013946 [Channa striata]